MRKPSNELNSYFENKDIFVTCNEGGGILKASAKVTLLKKLLGIKTDAKLKFEDHVKILFKKATQKINALAIESSYMIFQHRILNYVLISHFSYWPIVWTFHSRQLNNGINPFHATGSFYTP